MHPLSQSQKYFLPILIIFWHVNYLFYVSVYEEVDHQNHLQLILLLLYVLIMKPFCEVCGLF